MGHCRYIEPLGSALVSTIGALTRALRKSQKAAGSGGCRRCLAPIGHRQHTQKEPGPAYRPDRCAENLTGLLQCRFCSGSCSEFGPVGLPQFRAANSAATLISLSRHRCFRPAVWPAGIARVFGRVCPVYLRPDNRPRSWTAVGVVRF